MNKTVRKKGNDFYVAGDSDKCCVNCKHFRHLDATHDQPYPEFWCAENEWDGIASKDELYAETDCELFDNV